MSAVRASRLRTSSVPDPDAACDYPYLETCVTLSRQSPAGLAGVSSCPDLGAVAVPRKGGVGTTVVYADRFVPEDARKRAGELQQKAAGNPTT